MASVKKSRPTETKEAGGKFYWWKSGTAVRTEPEVEDGDSPTSQETLPHDDERNGRSAPRSGEQEREDRYSKWVRDADESNEFFRDGRERTGSRPTPEQDRDNDRRDSLPREEARAEVERVEERGANPGKSFRALDYRDEPVGLEDRVSNQAPLYDEGRADRGAYRDEPSVGRVDEREYREEYPEVDQRPDFDQRSGDKDRDRYRAHSEDVRDEDYRDEASREGNYHDEDYRNENFRDEDSRDRDGREQESVDADYQRDDRGYDDEETIRVEPIEDDGYRGPFSNFDPSRDRYGRFIDADDANKPKFTKSVIVAAATAPFMFVVATVGGLALFGPDEENVAGIAGSTLSQSAALSSTGSGAATSSEAGGSTSVAGQRAIQATQVSNAGPVSQNPGPVIVPSGADILHVSLDGDRLALTVTAEGGDFVMLYDTRAGSMLGQIPIGRSASGVEEISLSNVTPSRKNN